MSDNVYVIYHRNDNDGRASGWVAKTLFPGAQMIGYDIVDSSAEIDSLPNGSKVIMLDIFMKPQEMKNLSNRVDLIWVDHHRKENAEMAPLLNAKTEIVFDPEISACRGAWRRFFSETDEPDSIKLIGLYDVRDKTDIKLWKEEVLPYEEAIRSFKVLTAEDFGKVVTENTTETLLEIGREITVKKQAEIDQVADELSYVDTIQGKKALVIWSGVSDYIFNTKEYEQAKPDMVVFLKGEKNGKFAISIAQGEDKNFDCQDFAAKYGGGGHLRNAGFKILPHEVPQFLGLKNVSFESLESAVKAKNVIQNQNIKIV